MKNSFFRGKKITVMGLGLLGRGVGDVRFLARRGARLTVTDLKERRELTSSLRELRGLRNIEYVLGRHRVEDFRGRDFILKAAGVPQDSSYIAEARKQGIPVEMDESLFLKCAPPVMTVGVTGTRGKTTTTQLIYEIVKAAGRTAHLGGNVKGIATLPLLERVKTGDTVVMELSSWQLQGFGESKISPHVAVFTTFLSDHMNYYRNDESAYWNDKANIFLNQKKSDVIIAPLVVARRIRRSRPKLKSRLVIARPSDIPSSWRLRLLGEHNRANAACAVRAADALGIPRRVARKVLESFGGVEGRLQLVSSRGGVEIYNDTTATTPDATLAGLKTLARKRNVVLIMGGFDKGLDMRALVAALPRYAKTAVLLAGTGTDRIRAAVRSSRRLNVLEAATLAEAVRCAKSAARAGDRVLFSPAFASFGMFKNEFDRGDRFNRLIR